ncbi:beta-propeller domain-containing protein [Nonomuraea sp. NPDC046570]|uniref:beta-propeller domain-containing protein n=1 Tax=Nonomuraea sp. NPDC046570 TaxID=3155255 RepID=UPI0033C33037
MKTLIRTALSTAVLAAACAACTSSSGESASPRIDLSDVRLVSYSGCDDMLSGLREHTAKNVGPWGIGGVMAYGGDAAMAKNERSIVQDSPQHSTTNVHEAGVDEPDLVKTDGDRVITVNQGKLRVIDAATKKVTSTLTLIKDENLRGMPGDLLVSGDRALVLFNGGGFGFGTMDKRAFAPTGPQYVLVDLAGEPKVLGTVKPKGEHVDARLVGSTVRLVVRSQPEIVFPQPRDDVPEAERTKVNQATVRQAPIDAWLPAFQITDASGSTRDEKVSCDKVSHPADYTGTSMLTVHTLDLNQNLTGTDPISVAADGDTVYGTGTSLYVASNPRWWFPIPIDPAVMETVTSDTPEATPTDSATAVPPADEPTPVEPTPVQPEPKLPPEETEVHRFDVSGAGPPKYVASGRVPGRLLNQYSLSEYDGNLRVATTSATEKSSSSSVYVLKADTLGKVGEVGGLGKGERIYSVRFIGPVGYVVTFKQVDPLYTLDLANPAAPRVTGELKITGYSAYLHPAGEGRLIGVGQEASDKGRTLGTQVSLFDVSDPANPRRLSQMFQKDSGSEAEWNPHAFLYWPKTGLSVIPVSSYSEKGGASSGALVLKIDPSGVSKVGTIKHPEEKQGDYTYEPAVQRSLVIGETLWTISEKGVKVNDLNTLAEQAWIPLS